MSWFHNHGGDYPEDEGDADGFFWGDIGNEPNDADFHYHNASCEFYQGPPYEGRAPPSERLQSNNRNPHQHRPGCDFYQEPSSQGRGPSGLKPGSNQREGQPKPQQDYGGESFHNHNSNSHARLHGDDDDDDEDSNWIEARSRGEPARAPSGKFGRGNRHGRRQQHGEGGQHGGEEREPPAYGDSGGGGGGGGGQQRRCPHGRLINDGGGHPQYQWPFGGGRSGQWPFVGGRPGSRGGRRGGCGGH